MDEVREGGCVCRRIRYRLRGEPIAFYVCHCIHCQMDSGSAFGLSMVVRREALEPLTAGLALVPLPTPSGREVRVASCEHCGTRVWGERAEIPQIRSLSPATLDDPRAWTPYGNMWTVRALPWVALAPGPRFERQPEDPLAMVRAWHARPRS